jgi:hypothetical protein
MLYPRVTGNMHCRGVRFNQLLTECFSFHGFENLSALNSGCKKDPRLSQSSQRDMELRNLRFAIEHGDIVAVRFRHDGNHIFDGSAAAKTKSRSSSLEANLKRYS